MKPGAKKLLDYLKQTLSTRIKLTDYQLVSEKWTQKTLERAAKSAPDLFEQVEGCIQLKQKKSKDMGQYIKERERVMNELEQFLVGPFETEEVLGRQKNPMRFYLTGKLVPLGSSDAVVKEEELEVETHKIADGDSIDENLSQRDVFRPSSLGLSFKMRTLSELKITASWGMYKGKEHERQPYVGTWTILPGVDDSIVLNEDNGALDPARVKCTVMKRQDMYHVSVFLYNAYRRENQYPKQEEVMFQTKLSVQLDREVLSTFSSKSDQYNLQDELLYRDQKEVVIGHGVGVDWEITEDEATLYTTWLPRYELPSIAHRKLDNQLFSMRRLADMSTDELVEQLTLIPSAYKDWLEKESKKVTQLEPALQAEAKNNIEKIHVIINRIEEGIQLLTQKQDDTYREAFRFANLSMMHQRAQTTVALKYRSTNKRIKPIYDGEWRLFQLAFILMNIAGVSNRNHHDREIVDLIWFPTGGGKTEAYLGVAAYLMAYRRLSTDVSQVENYAGVTVFMRYTLRLLTTQQFQRATALICAAEYLRVEKPELYGEEPFSIGLWIGGDSSPNKLEKAEAALDQLKNGEDVLKSNPMQLTHCPWCGTELTPDDYDITKTGQHIQCSHVHCDFHSQEGIPVYTVDEAIYNKVPTIVIGTVDKVAQLPWKNDMYELFGIKNQYSKEKGFVYNDEKVKRGYRRIESLIPPELIIQDELHLISGPLGSLTGLYEVAFDLLCEYNGRRPKVIASTATIRGADEQVCALYARSVCQFPLAVQKSTDNFVSYQVDIKDQPGRMYLGLCAPGTSNKIQAIDTYAALTTISHRAPADVSDPYYTTLGYFNTLKELAGTLTTFKDEIPSRLNLLDPKNTFSHDLVVEEMTSRKKAKEIPELLTKMERGFKDVGTLDAVLATNMISVGVDVNRLGLMVMHGQPKTTSEYIQATSRVGREYPGLVVTIFNSMRSRDLTHFERFKSYHQAIYRHVEPMSVTPFSSGSLRKGLTGSFIGFLRQSLVEISNEKQASQFKRSSQVEKLKERFIERAVNTGGWTQSEATTILDSYLDWWEDLSHEYDDLSYRINTRFPQFTKHPLMRQFTEQTKFTSAKPAMSSLRNVEGEIKLKELTIDE